MTTMTTRKIRNSSPTQLTKKRKLGNSSLKLGPRNARRSLKISMMKITNRIRIRIRIKIKIKIKTRIWTQMHMQTQMQKLTMTKMITTKWRSEKSRCWILLKRSLTRSHSA